MKNIHPDTMKELDKGLDEFTTIGFIKYKDDVKQFISDHFIDNRILKADLELWLLRLKCEPETWTVKQALQSLLKDNENT